MLFQLNNVNFSLQKSTNLLVCHETVNSYLKSGSPPGPSPGIWGLLPMDAEGEVNIVE